jgi:hypothetical protein
MFAPSVDTGSRVEFLLDGIHEHRANDAALAFALGSRQAEAEGRGNKSKR